MKKIYILRIFQHVEFELLFIVAESDEECLKILLEDYLQYKQPGLLSFFDNFLILIYSRLIKKSKHFALADDEVESGIVKKYILW